MTNEIRKLIETIEKIEEAKWDYPKAMKGKGAAYKEVGGSKGSKNRKSRKAFRKAQKAVAHAERMSGQQVEEEHIEIIGEEPVSSRGGMLKDFRNVLAEFGIVKLSGRAYNDKLKNGRKLRIYINRTDSSRLVHEIEPQIQEKMEDLGYIVKKVAVFNGVQPKGCEFSPGLGRDAKCFPNAAIWIENPIQETVEIIGENRYDDLEDVINQLSDIKEQISGLVYDAASLVEGTNEEDSAKSYWIGHILGALDNESEYGGGSMTTMQDTIDALGEGENFEDDDEWPETDGNPYGDDRHNERGI